MQLLRRKKIRRDILMQYLARKSIPISPGADKVCIQSLDVKYLNSLVENKVSTILKNKLCIMKIDLHRES